MSCFSHTLEYDEYLTDWQNIQTCCDGATNFCGMVRPGNTDRPCLQFDNFNWTEWSVEGRDACAEDYDVLGNRLGGMSAVAIYRKRKCFIEYLYCLRLDKSDSKSYIGMF